MPEPLPQTAAEIEPFVRELIAEKCRAVVGSGHVATKRFYVVGRQQYVENLGREVFLRGEEGADPTPANMEVHILFVEFLGYEDTPRGCDDAPHYQLVYSFRAVKEFVEERADGSNSSDEFAAYILNLRDAFLRDRHFGYPARLAYNPLRQSGSAQIGDDEFTGIFGHIAPFILKVEVVP